MTRPVDLALYAADGSEALAEAGPFGAALTGPARLAQRVAYELLTEPGTVAGRAAGTRLAAAVRGAANTLDVAAAFTAGADAVLGRLVAEEAADAPDDERVVGIYLISVAVAEGEATLTVRVVTAAGVAAGAELVVDVPPAGGSPP